MIAFLRHNQVRDGWRRVVGCLAIWIALGATAFAETGTVQTLPDPRVRMRSGLTVEIDTRGVSANGYRSIRVKLINTPMRNRPPVAVTADRRLRVVLEPLGIGHLSAVSASQVIEIPEKQSSAQATIAVPTSGDWYQLRVHVYEGGSKLNDVSGPVMTGFFGMRSDAESLPTLLLIDQDVPARAARNQLLGTMTVQGSATTDTYNLPDISQLLAELPYTNLGIAPTTTVVSSDAKRLTDLQVLTMIAQHGKVQLLPLGELPQRWIDLSCYDIAFVSLADLEKMSRQLPSRRRALVDWLHGGPALVVYGAGDDFSKLAAIEKLLELRPVTQPQGDAYRGWTTPDTSDRGRAIVNRQQNVYSSSVSSSGSPVAATSVKTRNGVHPPFVSRPAGLGWVVAIGEEDPFPGNFTDWNWVINSIPSRHQHWSTRHGISYQSYNQGLWNWYIPGVGAAPVFSFLLLATLFAIVIGPVNYLVLGRIQRLYLLLITVPVGAAFVTLGLFAYAVLSDGLAVKARIRSFTLLDQQSGRAVSWSRQSYYASLVPSQGLKFPADTIVWPMDEKPLANRQGRSRLVAWEPDGQRLKSGYLSSRRLTQLMVIRAAKSKGKLTVVEKSNGAAPDVTSSLPGMIEQLVLRDAEGNYFCSSGPVKSAKGAELHPLPPEDARRLIGKIFSDHRPDFPVGYDPVAEARRNNSPWNRMYWGGDSSSAILESSILETSLSQLQTSTDKALTPGSYLAVMESNGDVPLGVPAVTESQSFHVIVGRW